MLGPGFFIKSLPFTSSFFSDWDLGVPFFEFDTVLNLFWGSFPCLIDHVVDFPHVLVLSGISLFFGSEFEDDVVGIPVSVFSFPNLFLQLVNVIFVIWVDESLFFIVSLGFEEIVDKLIPLPVDFIILLSELVIEFPLGFVGFIVHLSGLLKMLLGLFDLRLEIIVCLLLFGGELFTPVLWSVPSISFNDRFDGFITLNPSFCWSLVSLHLIFSIPGIILE